MGDVFGICLIGLITPFLASVSGLHPADVTAIFHQLLHPPGEQSEGGKGWASGYGSLARNPLGCPLAATVGFNTHTRMVDPIR